MSRPDSFSKLQVAIQNPGDHSCDLRATWCENGGVVGCRDALLFRCVSVCSLHEQVRCFRFR